MLLTSLNLSPPKIKYSGGLLAGHFCKFPRKYALRFPGLHSYEVLVEVRGVEILGQF